MRSYEGLHVVFQVKGTGFFHYEPYGVRKGMLEVLRSLSSEGAKIYTHSGETPHFDTLREKGFDAVIDHHITRAHMEDIVRTLGPEQMDEVRGLSTESHLRQTLTEIFPGLSNEDLRAQCVLVAYGDEPWPMSRTYAQRLWHARNPLVDPPNGMEDVFENHLVGIRDLYPRKSSPRAVEAMLEMLRNLGGLGEHGRLFHLEQGVRTFLKDSTEWNSTWRGVEYRMLLQSHIPSGRLDAPTVEIIDGSKYQG